MKLVWQLFYDRIVVPLFWVMFHLAGLVNEKVRRGISGRKDLFKELEEKIGTLGPGKRAWVHSSSMGEFEQAKPIISTLRETFPDLKIIVTFFSPSGYENSINSPLADVVSYLPFDSPASARRFAGVVKPDIGILVRYDVWPNHIWILRKMNIPVFIANATISRLTLRRLPLVKSFHRWVYDDLQEILTVSEHDLETFETFRLKHARLRAVGDTRFDQVALRSAEARGLNVLPRGVLDGKKTVVAGSCWDEDDQVLIPAFTRLLSTAPDTLLVHVPHEPTTTHLESLEQRLGGRLSFRRLSTIDHYEGESVIIIDSIGKLLALYASADVAYIGGSFGQGIHNVLEAAAYGIPVLFGPQHHNSQEPLQLIGQGGGFVVEDTDALYRTALNLLKDDLARAECGKRAADFVHENTGATSRVVERLSPFLTPRRDRQLSTTISQPR